jgi:hypothetical protein
MAMGENNGGRKSMAGEAKTGENRRNRRIMASKCGGMAAWRISGRRRKPAAAINIMANNQRSENENQRENGVAAKRRKIKLICEGGGENSGMKSRQAAGVS